jgi:MraZ protein
MLLTGAFHRSLDEKQRVAIPKRLRDDMGCGEGGWLYVSPGLDRSLALYTESAFVQLGDKLAQSSPTRSDVRAFARLFYGQSQRLELDRQGRIRIPPELAALAGLEKEVMLVGVQDHLELWSAASWNDYIAKQQEQYDQIAETALSVRS